jgi:MFS family permease
MSNSNVRFLPESPRFLIAKDRHEEALNILVKYHAEGDASSRLVQLEFQEIRETIQKEKLASKQPWKELFTTSTNIRRVLIAVGVGLFAQWSGNGLVSYYLAKVLTTVGITSRLAQNQINLGLNCWNFVAGVSASFLQHYIPRRAQWLTSFVGMTVVYACWTATAATYANDMSNEHASRAVVALIFVYYGFYNIFMPLAYLYITEVFPYILRSKGMAIMLLMSRFGSAFNAFINPIALSAISWRMYIVYTCWLAIETTYIYFLYPETFGLSLEASSKQMDQRKISTAEDGEGYGRTSKENVVEVETK